MKDPFETSFGEIRTRNIVVLIGKKNGKEYFGEASAQFAPLYNHETTETDIHFIRNFVIPTLKEADSIEDYNQLISCYKGNSMAKAAGEFLLYHRKSMENGKSLKELVGGREQKAESGVSISLQDKPDHLVEKVREYREKGYKRAKVKIKPGKDIDYIRRVRDEYPNFSIMVDANSSYTLNDKKRLKKLDEFDLQMIEQPLSHRDLFNHSKLSKYIQTPICLDESIRTARDVKKAAQMNSCEIINLKPQRVGGLTESRKINQICKSEDMELWIGGLLESGIGASFALAAASMSEVSYPNDLAPSSRYFKQDVIDPEIDMTNGEIDLVDKPGLAGDIDKERLDKFTERKIIERLD